MTADPLQPLIDALRLALLQADGTSLATVADQVLRGQSATLGISLILSYAPLRPGSGKGPAHERYV